jgi:hypothetical protein
MRVKGLNLPQLFLQYSIDWPIVSLHLLIQLRVVSKFLKMEQAGDLFDSVAQTDVMPIDRTILH